MWTTVHAAVEKPVNHGKNIKKDGLSTKYSQ
jgi:hypothetical protein